MINNAICIDIETISQEKYYTDLPEKQKLLWETKCDIFYNKYKKDYDDFYNDCWEKYAALNPEFSRLICMSFSVRHPKTNKLTSQTLHLGKIPSHKEECELIKKIFEFISICPNELNYKYLAGHNIKNFDIPFLCKKAIIHGISYKSFPKWLKIRDSKPWELDYILDTKELYRFGSVFLNTTLDEMSYSFGIDSPKDGNVSGDKIYDFIYFDGGDINDVISYCENDTICTYEVLEKLI